MTNFDNEISRKYHNQIIQTEAERMKMEHINKVYADLGGIKHDQGKPRFDLIPHDALMDLAQVYTFGATKYNDHNWAKGMKWSRVFAAMMRHAWAYWGGEDLDPESKLPHMSHVAWCAMTLLSYRKRKVGEDDRFTQVSQPKTGNL